MVQRLIFILAGRGMEKLKRSFLKTNTFKTVGPALLGIIAVLWIGGLAPYDMIIGLMHIKRSMLVSIILSGIFFVFPLLSRNIVYISLIYSYNILLFNRFEIMKFPQTYDIQKIIACNFLCKNGDKYPS